MAVVLAAVAALFVAVGGLVAFVGMFRDETDIETKLTENGWSKDTALPEAKRRVKRRRRRCLYALAIGILVGGAAVGAAVTSWHL